MALRAAVFLSSTGKVRYRGTEHLSRRQVSRLVWRLEKDLEYAKKQKERQGKRQGESKSERQRREIWGSTT